MIYLLEDDENIRELISYTLNKTGNETRGFGLPSALYSALEAETPSLFILDVMLPEEDGLTVLSRIRGSEKTKDVPVIMLTAKDSEYDKVMALDAGADDYITKPFGVMELVARVNAHLRRYARHKESSGETKLYTVSDVELSVEKHTVSAGGVPIELTYKEFSLLLFLLEHRGTVVSRDKILSEVWGYDFDGENRTVDVHIRTLRQKLGESGDVIETVRGIGYKIG